MRTVRGRAPGYVGITIAGVYPCCAGVLPATQIILCNKYNVLYEFCCVVLAGRCATKDSRECADS